jgi:hypothetical protein
MVVITVGIFYCLRGEVHSFIRVFTSQKFILQPLIFLAFFGGTHIAYFWGVVVNLAISLFKESETMVTEHRE